MHPIIQLFYDKMGVIEPSVLNTLIDPNHPIEQMLYKLTEQSEDKDSIGEWIIKSDEAMLVGHKDTQVFNLFLCMFIGRVSRLSIKKYPAKVTKILSIFSILEASFNDKDNLELQPLFSQFKAFIHHVKGDTLGSIKCYQEILESLKLTNPWYETIFLSYCNLLSTKGMLEAITIEQKEKLFELTKEKIYDTYYENILNSLLTLNVEEGLRLIEKYVPKFLKESKTLLMYKNLLTYFYNIFYHQQLPYEFDTELIQLLELMRAGYFVEAETLFLNVAKEKIHSERYRDLFMYFELHFAFAKKEKGKIQLLLNEKKNSSDYLDDFFYGRLHLLNNNFKNADFYFRRLTSNVKKYKAINRFLFELSFARELDYQVALRLAQGCPISITDNTIEENLEKKEKKINTEQGLDILIGVSLPFQSIKEQVKIYAKIPSSILILGETGTGKELIARAIHQQGPNKREPFLAINCGALTDSLLQSELFGYVAGAFTGAQKERKGIFEAAGKGTVFLDEFGEISPKLQVTLLRVLEANEIRMLGATSNKKISCKIIVATNANLKEAVSKKGFREDLYFRLTRFEIHLPPLRERKEDIPLLAQHFLDKNATKEEERKQLSLESLKAFMDYDWPGNIRELKNEIDRLYILNPDETTISLLHSNLYKPSEKQNKSISQDLKEMKEKQSPSIVSKTIDEEKEFLESLSFGTERRFRQIKELFKNHKKLTRLQIMTIVKISSATATKDLALLCEEGFIKKVTPTKSPRTHYFELQ